MTPLSAFGPEEVSSPVVGRKPKPTALKLAANNPGKRRLNDAEPKPPAFAAVPPCPDWLTGEARAYWELQAPIDHATGILTTADVHAYAGLALTWADVRAAEHARDRRKALEIYRAYATDFGKNPASRTRIKATPPDAHVDPISAFKAQRPARPA